MSAFWLRTAGVTALAAVVGFAAGVALSEIVGIAGYLVLHRPVGLKYLAFYSAATLAAAALATALRARRRTRGTAGGRR